MDTNDIDTLLKNTQGLVVVDEAYIDFAPEQSFLRHLGSFENLVVLQTLSKAWGMAAYRLGMAFAHEDIIQVLSNIKPPYNISGPIQQSTLTSLMNFQKKDEWVKQIKGERERLKNSIEEFSNVLTVYPSEANFLLVKFSNAAEVFSYLIDSQVIVRDKSKSEGCENCLRITIGTPEENDRLLLLLKSLA
jgi:histidinol-phosphate aminotransferase